MRGSRLVLPLAVAAATALFGSSAHAQDRLGVGLDLQAETSQMAGEQWINASRVDETFGYGAAGGSLSAWLLFLAKERVRAGPGLRIYGNYGAGGGGNRDYIFGFLSEAFMMGEYSLSAFEKFDAILGGRAGVALLFPGQEFGDEIARLQREGVGVWSVPRPGGLIGLDIGLRRKMTDKLSLRADLNAQYEQLFLFSTNEVVDDLRFQKYWNTHTIRLGLMIGAELGL